MVRGMEWRPGDTEIEKRYVQKRDRRKGKREKQPKIEDQGKRGDEKEDSAKYREMDERHEGETQK